MNYFQYKNGRFFAEGVAVADIVSEYGSPCYIYSRATFERHWQAFDSALKEYDHLVCYAVKANSNIGVLNALARLGSGFDIVSVGELERVLAAGGDPKKVVFSGVGKRADEMQRALEVGIYCFNVESEEELMTLNSVAKQLNLQAPVSLRVNPDVDAKTHPYISTGLKDNKFGIAIEHVEAVYLKAASLPNINVQGVDCHIGSQLTELSPFVDALKRVLLLIDRLQAQNINLQHIDLGGGLGIQYDDEQPPLPADYARAVASVLGDRQYKLLIEPGRAIAGNAGILVTKVEYIKAAGAADGKNFAIVDAAMNDLMRPALYSAWQKIIPLNESSDTEEKIYDVVGPVCETGDFLGKERALRIKAGDYLAVRSSGAYGFTMSSNYNTRERAAEIMVDGDTMHLVRQREKIADLFANESLLPEESC
ncbi:Diaminopimelate decarboxylase [hydrothermal vent metagenome]|uniref:diaminopimelate decarboxylase n=1 Tax=hydrothermal vent metagenome TaxID=652676 RepID=A0A3B1AA17_9ZZZZ